MEIPLEGEPVLAKIEHQNNLGKSSWYEVVFYREELGGDIAGWKSYSDSKTFDDGEQVVKWKYCENIL